jgi:hypothetical protein
MREGWRSLAACALTICGLAALLALFALGVVPAHADGAFHVTVGGTQALGKAVPIAGGNTARRVDYALRTSGGYPRLAFSVTQARETLYPQGQTKTMTLPDGTTAEVIGVVAGAGSATDPIGGTLLFDLQLRGAILPDHRIALQLASPTTVPTNHLTLEVTFPDSEANTVSGDAGGSLLLGPSASSKIVADVWGTQPAAASAPSADDPTLWYLTRGAGSTAYLLLVAVVALGIALGFQGFAGLVRAWRIHDLHQVLTLAMLAFTALHLVTLYLDPVKPFSLLQLVWPLADVYRPVWTALGVLALYLLLAVTVSSYLRRALANPVWFALHLLSYVAFVLLTLHGIVDGSDTTTPWMLGIYTGSCALVLALTLSRVYLAVTARHSGGEVARVPDAEPSTTPLR